MLGDGGRIRTIVRGLFIRAFVERENRDGLHQKEVRGLFCLSCLSVLSGGVRGTDCIRTSVRCAAPHLRGMRP